VVRQPDRDDHRRVFLGLTARADEHLAELSAAHLDELSRIQPMLSKVLSHKKG
jgi:DNA-binding MarR family transcriptional regulator